MDIYIWLVGDSFYVPSMGLTPRGFQRVVEPVLSCERGQRKKLASILESALHARPVPAEDWVPSDSKKVPLLARMAGLRSYREFAAHARGWIVELDHGAGRVIPVAFSRDGDYGPVLRLSEVHAVATVRSLADRLCELSDGASPPAVKK